MSDFDFLKEFGKNMGRDRLHETSASDWPAVSARLDARDAAAVRRRRLVGWAFPVGMAASLLWLATAFFQSERRADGLRAEVLTLKSSLEKLETASDTVVRHVEIIRFDTVYRTVVVRRMVEEYRAGGAFFDNGRAVATNALFEKKGEAVGTSAEILPKKLGENQLEPAENLPPPPGLLETANLVGDEKEAAEAAQLADFLTKKRMLTVAPLPEKRPAPVACFSKKGLPETGLAMISAPPAGQREMVVRRFRSPDFQLGARASLLYPVTDRAAGNSFSLGLTVEKELTNRLSLTAGADFGQMYFHVQPANLPGSGLPVPAPPTPDDELKRVSVGQPILDFSAGIRYGFLIKKRFCPSFSAAWVGEQANRQEVHYDFVNPVTEDESQTRLPGEIRHFNARGVQLGAGADWGMGRWSFGLSGFYQRQFMARDPFLAERFGLRAGGRYSF